MPRQLQRHQLAHGQRIGRGPGGDGGVEQEQFRRATAQGVRVDLFQAGVHPGGIGAEFRHAFRILIVDRLPRDRVQVQSPHLAVDAQGAQAEDLGQAALHGPAHGQHLPQPVLGMGIAQAEQHVFVGFAEDMRHIGVVAHDLDRCA